MALRQMRRRRPGQGSPPKSRSNPVLPGSRKERAERSRNGGSPQGEASADPKGVSFCVWQPPARLERYREHYLGEGMAMGPTSELVAAGSLSAAVIPFRPRRPLISIEYDLGDWAIFVIGPHGDRLRLASGVPTRGMVDRLAPEIRAEASVHHGVEFGLVG